MFKIIGGKLTLVAVEYITIRYLSSTLNAVPIQIKDVFHALNIKSQPLQTISDFARNRVAIYTSDLLEIGKLSDFHSIAPDFPAQPPRAESRAFPIVFHKADVMFLKIYADCLKAI